MNSIFSSTIMLMTMIRVTVGFPLKKYSRKQMMSTGSPERTGS